MKEMMKGILIDPFKKEVTKVEVPKWDLETIYETIGNGCDVIAGPVFFKDRDLLYIDDEGWYRTYEDDNYVGFIMPDWAYAIVGRALIVGTDDEGNSVSPKNDDVEYWRGQVTWRGPVDMIFQGTEMGLL